MGRWIAIDYGTKRIGIAISDYGGRIASPADVLPGRGHPVADARQLLNYADENDAGGLVVGWPLNMDGTAGPQAAHSAALAQALRREGRRPVELWDERLSSYQADQHLELAGMPARRRKALRDALAAQVILQSFLDARRSQPDAPDAEDAT